MTDREAREADKHPHEPEVPRAMTEDGQCLVCSVSVAIDKINAAVRSLAIGPKSGDNQDELGECSESCICPPVAGVHPEDARAALATSAEGEEHDDVAEYRAAMQRGRPIHPLARSVATPAKGEKLIDHAFVPGGPMDEYEKPNERCYAPDAQGRRGLICGAPPNAHRAANGYRISALDLAVALNSAQITPEDYRLGRDLVPLAERILKHLRRIRD